MPSPNLLFITPIRPLLAGSGLGMRAGMVIEALSRDFEVSVVVVPVVGEPPSAPAVPLKVPTKVLPVYESADSRRLFSRDPQTRLARLALYPKPSLFRFVTPETVTTVHREFAGRHLDVVHVFRLYMAPFIKEVLAAPRASSPTLWLDLDEIESRTHLRLAELHEASGDPVSATMERAESTKYAQAESEYLPLFDRVFVCSEHERAGLSNLCDQQRAFVLPNAIRMPEKPLPAKSGGPFTFLFVGTLGYYPNEDAAIFFCKEVLPQVRAAAGETIQLVIAGSQPPGTVCDLASRYQVTVAANVSNMADLYKEADAVVVPIRAGGGTRIKVLEAFSHHRPVVSTPVGAEGLSVSHGEQILLASDAEGLSNCCIRLIHERRLGDALAAHAWEWVRQHHTVDALRQHLLPHYPWTEGRGDNSI
jgi:glycosyltransferase involved in cell wall biosynthesis